jgi:hypothetical protein
MKQNVSYNWMEKPKIKSQIRFMFVLLPSKMEWNEITELVRYIFIVFTPLTFTMGLNSYSDFCQGNT